MSEKPRWVENSIMRLALNATEATLGRNGLNAVLRVALLDRYIEHAPPNDHQLATPGTDFAALLAGIMQMYGEHVARGEPLHTLRQDSNTFVITFDDCLYCHALRTAEPICLTITATLETVLKWGTGHEYAVSETTCAARGDEVCTFVVDKHPLHV